MMRQFKIVVPSFNAVDYIGKCLASVEKQTFKDYQVCVVDDGSTLPEQREIIRDFCSRNNWLYRFNDKNYGALYSLVHAIQDLKCVDDDVIIILDGDDWLAHEHALTKWHEVYSQKDIYLTWGQAEEFPVERGVVKLNHPIPDMVIDQNLYRDIPFVFLFATYKYFLWRHIKDEDLREETGEYYRILKDKATVYPMLEMAGHKIQFIPETLYIYNRANPLNDYRTNFEEYTRVNRLILKKSRYTILDACK